MDARQIYGYPGYTATEDGQIIGPGRWGKRSAVSQHKMHGKYWRVGIVVGTRRIFVCVHRLVCIAFHGTPPSRFHHVRHLDGNVNNNMSTNLAWGTAAENAADSIRHGSTARGERNGSARLTATEVIEIRRRYMNGELQVPLSVEYGISQSQVSSIVLRKSWSTLP